MSYRSERVANDLLGLTHAAYGSPEWERGYKAMQEATKKYPDTTYESEYGGYKTPCQNPVEWDVDTSICANDGRKIEDHSRPVVRKAVKPYEQAIMAWFVRHGGIDNYYGGISDGASAVVKKHILDDCGLNLLKCSLPEPHTFEEFAGTFADSGSKVEGLEGRLTCRCGKVDDEEWALKRDISLGEIIYQVVQEGIK